MPTKFFGTVRQKSFDTKSWHKSLKPKIFRYPKVMTHWWDPLRSFSALSDKKFWPQIVILPPPSYPYILSRTEIFWCTDQKGSSTRLFGTVRQKSFDTKSWSNSLKPKIFPYPKIMTHWWVPLRIFSALSDKKILTKNRDTPTRPPLIHKFFGYQNFCIAKNGSSTKIFGTVRQKFFIRK